jgi:DNA-binding XRE family transcriptional regulator
VSEQRRLRRQAFGDAVRRVRGDASQEALGERAEWSRQAVNRLENGHSSSLLDDLWRLADGLGVPLSAVVQEAEDAIAGACSRCSHDPHPGTHCGVLIDCHCDYAPHGCVCPRPRSTACTTG